jgi:hypothetical protein
MRPGPITGDPTHKAHYIWLCERFCARASAPPVIGGCMLLLHSQEVALNALLQRALPLQQLAENFSSSCSCLARAPLTLEATASALQCVLLHRRLPCSRAPRAAATVARVGFLFGCALPRLPLFAALADHSPLLWLISLRCFGVAEDQASRVSHAAAPSEWSAGAGGPVLAAMGWAGRLPPPPVYWSWRGTSRRGVPPPAASPPICSPAS